VGRAGARRPEDLGPGVDGAVMATLRAAPLALAAPVRQPGRARPARGGATTAWEWLTRPRTLRVSPIGALAAAALAFIATFLGVRREAPSTDRAADDPSSWTGEFPVPARSGEQVAMRPAVEGRTADATPAGARDTVYIHRFMLVAPSAQHVALVGDFNDWDQAATTLQKVSASGAGLWTVEVSLPPGRYSYAFLVDGQRWVADPAAPRAVGDDFGRPSSVVTVRGTDA
jgi:hypothetical protein